MSTPRRIIVIKKYRPKNDPLKDIPISFGPLVGLHLDMLEIKKKLKKGLPAIYVEPKILPKNSSEGKTKNVAKTPIKGNESSGRHSEEITENKNKSIKKGERIQETSTFKKKGNKIKEDQEDENEDDEDQDIEDDEDNDEDNQDIDEEGDEEEEEEIDEEGEDQDIGEDEDDDLDELQETPSGKKKSHTPTGDESGEEVTSDPNGSQNETEQQQQEPEDPTANMTPEEKEKYDKEEYIWRFRILKKKHKNLKINDYTELDDLESMKTIYHRTLRDVELDSNIDSYKSYLIASWMAFEWGCCNFVNVDMKGFADSQMKIMNKYESLLVELGERSYSNWGRNIPVELKLIGLVLFQAGLFYLGKLTGMDETSLLGMFSAMSGQNLNLSSQDKTTETKTLPPIKTNPSNNSNEKTEKRMRGPSIKPNDIRNELKKKDIPD